MDRINPQPVYDWFKTNKKQLIIAGSFLAIAIIVMNNLIGIYAKADLLINSCELCVRSGYSCTPRITNFVFNITK